MDFIDYTRQKLKSVLHEIDQLRKADFPHRHSADCLDRIGTLLKNELNQVEKISPRQIDSVKSAICLQANSELVRFHELLGFVLRSTNVRNAFELFDPLLRIANQLLDNKPKLVLSSEWVFSPFTYVQVLCPILLKRAGKYI